MSAAARSLHILLVDDNAADLLLAQEVFGEYGQGARVTACQGGAEALELLRAPVQEEGHEQGQGQGLPDVIILDLNMPGLSGFEVLQAVKSDPALVEIPVVILSTSSATEDVERAYTLHASSYMVKSPNFQTFVEQVDAFLKFWQQSRLTRWPGGAGGGL